MQIKVSHGIMSLNLAGKNSIHIYMHKIKAYNKIDGTAKGNHHKYNNNNNAVNCRIDENEERQERERKKEITNENRTIFIWLRRKK